MISKQTTLPAMVGDIAFAMLGTLVVLAGFAAVNFAQGAPNAEAEAQTFKTLESEGLPQSDLCRQAKLTRSAFAREGNAIEFQQWRATAVENCRDM